MRAHSRAGDGAGPTALQRAGELHARRPLHARRGARAAELLRRGRLQLRRHRSRRRAPARRSRLDRRRRADDGPVGRRHPPLHALPAATAATWRDAHARKSLGLLYAMHWPFRQPETARGVRRSLLHDRLAARGACFGEVAGWERANWFAPAGVEPRYDVHLRAPELVRLRRRRAPRRARDRRPLRPDRRSPNSGSRAPTPTAMLQRLCANDVAVPAGRIVYTQMLNGRGGIECDLTVTRARRRRATSSSPSRPPPPTTPTGSAAAIGDARVTLTDVTSAFAVARRHGPTLPRDPLAPDPRRPVERDVPVRTAREIEVGYATRARHAHHLRRRAGLGAVRPDRIRAGRLRGRDRGRRGPRPAPRRLPRDGLAAAREGLPLVGPRHRRRRHAAGGRPGLRGRLQEGRVRRA